MPMRGVMPYARAMSRTAPRDEIVRALFRAGCTHVQFADYTDAHVVILEFWHDSQKYAVRTSARGWAAAHLRDFPHTSRSKLSPREYRARVLKQGMIAVNSILKDWVKNQLAVIETGAFSFDDVFMPFMEENNERLSA